MKTNGHQLQQAIREKKALLEVLNSQLAEALKQFEGEDKGNPLMISKEILEVESSLVKLQCGQDRYNETIVGNYDDRKTASLGWAIKMVGGVGRMEKFWRNAAAPKRDRYAYNADERSKENEYAKPMVSPQDALAEHKKYSQLASRLRAFIAQANTEEIDPVTLGISPNDLG
jgi:hypothetical protein